MPYQQIKAPKADCQKESQIKSATDKNCPLCQLHKSMQELLPKKSSEQNRTLKTLASIWCNPAVSGCKVLH